ncbi:MAG: TetM/TetW/TetO/TetS family tetracycline resistance ribosomal protection protein [Butyrivibrio sp.]|nr:TetM/TetW/TetO/TetS family tetracycline resistance ribosomal protection protein [Butyrivibrio sp.]
MNKNVTIGILAHVDAGKTTLSEAILYTSGTIRNLGRVDHKDAFLDTYELERSRGITIFSKQALFDYNGASYTLLDTPGHSDFSPEMERTLQVLDAAVLIISAADGVTSQVKLLWKLLDHYKIPVFIFVNKMDQPGADKAGIMDALSKELSRACICFDTDFKDPEFQEELAVCEEELLAGFLDGRAVSDEDAKRLINSRLCFPVIFGSALKLEGVEKLLEVLSEYSCDCTKKDNAHSVDNKNDFAARVFKISRDPQGVRLTHIKVLSGGIKVRDLIGSEKVDQIRLYNGEKYTPLQEATKGMVVAITGLLDSRPGEGLGTLSGTQVSEVVQPILSCSLILPEDVDTLSFYRKLKALEEEEPMLLINYHEASKTIEVQVMGKVQQEILKHLIMTRLGIEVSFGPGHIVYKETITGAVEGVGHFEPLRHYAEVHLLLEPTEPGSGISFGNACHTDDLALNWQRLILTHLQEKKHLGVLTGSEITDIKITLLTGRAHEKHTEGGDFRQATYRAIRQGLMMADSVLLEPVFEYRIEVPEQSVGRVLSDMQRMNGTVSLPDLENGKSVITGTVPAACLLDYASELSSFTHGEGSISTTLSGYAPCHNTEEVLESMQYYPELDNDNPASSVFCSHGAGTIIPWDEVRNYMHLDTGWRPEGGTEVKTDLIDNIDMEALKKLQAKSTRKQEDERSFAEIDRDLRFTENELKDIFERTYGTIKPRYVETEEDRRRYALQDAKREREKAIAAGLIEEPEGPEVTLSAKKQSGKKEQRLIERQKEYLLVDGYNVIYASDRLKSLAVTDLKAARDLLVDILINFQGYRRENVILVFDAYKVPGGIEHMEERAGLTIIYTKEAETADQYIEKAAHEIGKKYRVTVATSDAIEQVIVMSSGAIRLSARDFWAEIERTNEMIREHL